MTAGMSFPEHKWMGVGIGEGGRGGGEGTVQYTSFTICHRWHATSNDFALSADGAGCQGGTPGQAGVYGLHCNAVCIVKLYHMVTKKMKATGKAYQMGPGATALQRIPLLGSSICARPFVNILMAPFVAA